jgi:hypothetical protein
MLSPYTQATIFRSMSVAGQPSIVWRVTPRIADSNSSSTALHANLSGQYIVQLSPPFMPVKID